MLFNDRPLDAYLAARTAQAVAAVDREDADDVRESAPEVAQRVINRMDIAPLELDASKPTTESFEGTVAQRDSFSHETFMVKGLGVRATARLSGDVALLRLKPSSFGLSGPPAAIYTDSTLTIEVIRPQLTADEARDAIRGEFARIEQYIEWVNTDIEVWRPRLGEAVRQAVSERAQRLRAGSSLDNLFDGE